MLSYFSAFLFYTMAMIGLLFVGFIIYKKITPQVKSDSKGMIKILDSLPIGAKKTLLVVKIKEEKFLIASGLEHTTFLAKLEDSPKNENKKEQIIKKQLQQTQMRDYQPQTEQKIPQISYAQNVLNSYANSSAQTAQNFQSYLKNSELQAQNIAQQQTNTDFVTQIRKTDKQRLIKQLLKDLNEQKAR